ncbi:MAG: DDE-type integrase/transposase/recombinase [Candidatus Helarchaeota archaeon]
MSKLFFETSTITVNDISSQVEVPILCPISLRGCKSKEIVKNGHDTSVKGSPQIFHCKDCGKYFYAHTSAFFQEVELRLREELLEFFVQGKFNADGLKSMLNCSKSTISRIFQQVVNAMNESTSLLDLWSFPKSCEALFVDETWININGKTFYLIVVVNEEQEVLAWDLVESRTKERIISILRQVESRIDKQISILVTDDFSTYKGVATGLAYDLTHVRHVHKPPYGRICIDLIRHSKKSVKTIHVATMNDIFQKENTFLVRVSESQKTKHETGKRGRKKGSKNRPKKIIRAEKKRKRKRKKRGPKNPFKHGKTHVYHYFNDERGIGVLGHSNPEIGANLEELAKIFKEKCITTNLIEQEFSSLKKLIDFRGKRTLSTWISTINFYFTIRANPEILERTLQSTRICPHTIHRLPLGGSFIPAFSKHFLSKSLREEICQV